MFNEFTREHATRYLANAEFTQAVLYFKDGSFLQFEHKGRDKRWARPSTDDTTAATVCEALRLFRLNAKHLQLFFEDGSDAEFFAPDRGL
jgi:hypothetical protein